MTTLFYPQKILEIVYKGTFIYYSSIRRHLDYTSARLRRAVKVSSLLSTDLTALKSEKTAVFALTRLRNTAAFLFSVKPLRYFRQYCTPKCTMYPFVLALPHLLLSFSLYIIGAGVALFRSS